MTKRYKEYYIIDNVIWGSMGEEDYMNDVELIKCSTYATARGIIECFERDGVKIEK